MTFPRPAFESLKKFGLPRRLGREVGACFICISGRPREGRTISDCVQLDSAGGPACVVRKQTLEMATLLDKAKTNGSSRHVLCTRTPIAEFCWHVLTRPQAESAAAGNLCCCCKLPTMHFSRAGLCSTSRTVRMEQLLLPVSSIRLIFFSDLMDRLVVRIPIRCRIPNVPPAGTGSQDDRDNACR